MCMYMQETFFVNEQSQIRGGLKGSFIRGLSWHLWHFLVMPKFTLQPFRSLVVAT